jgi:hypothetical protein
MTIQFIPKTAAERQAFLRQAEAEKLEADLEEQRLRREWYPRSPIRSRSR